MPNWGQYSSTALVLDTFYGKYCLLLTQYLKIYLNFATSVLSKHKNCITTSNFYMGLYVTRYVWIRFLRKYLNRRFLLLLLTSKTNLEAINEDSPKDNVNLGQWTEEYWIHAFHQINYRIDINRSIQMLNYLCTCCNPICQI